MTKREKVAIVAASDTDLAYAAGLMDGEGSICIAICRSRYLRPVVEVSNTKPEILLWLRERFGGSVPCPVANGRNAKPLFKWNLGGAQPCRDFLRRILPYLILKRAQAQLVFEFTDTVRRGRKLTADIEDYRAKLSSQVRFLNKRGVA